jgi:glycosyltransferase involved in cell wall biosynthesis
MALNRIRPDVYVSPDAQASLRTKVPQLVVIHDINFEHYPEDLPGIYSRYLRKYSRRFAEHAHRIATVSEFSKQDISRQYHVSPDKIDVVYNGVNEGFYPLSATQKEESRQKYSDGKPYFIFVGTIHPRKNLQRLIPAFDQFVERTGADVNLVVVGNAFFLNDELRSAMGEMKLPERLKMVGRLDAAELHNAVGASLANVYISYFEGFGIPILEGFQCGVPVITSNVTSMPEVAGDAALLVDPFSVESISEALERIYASPSFAEELVNKGKQRMKDFSWDRTSVLLWESIQKTLHGKA